MQNSRLDRYTRPFRIYIVGRAPESSVSSVIASLGARARAADRGFDEELIENNRDKRIVFQEWGHINENPIVSQHVRSEIFVFGRTFANFDSISLSEQSMYNGFKLKEKQEDLKRTDELITSILTKKVLGLRYIFEPHSAKSRTVLNYVLPHLMKKNTFRELYKKEYQEINEKINDFNKIRPLIFEEAPD